jgi:ketosteroid isomerase-like protein
MRHVVVVRIAAAAALWVSATNCTSSENSVAQQSAAAGGDVSGDRAAVEEAVRTHWKAINIGDTATLNAQHASEISITMTEMPDRFVVPSPTADSLFPNLLKYKPRYVVENLQVQLFGDVAVASFDMSGGVVRPDGKLDDRRRRVTEVWVRQANVWKEVHHHDSVFST